MHVYMHHIYIYIVFACICNMNACKQFWLALLPLILIAKLNMLTVRPKYTNCPHCLLFAPLSLGRFAAFPVVIIIIAIVCLHCCCDYCCCCCWRYSCKLQIAHASLLLLLLLLLCNFIANAVAVGRKLMNAVTFAVIVARARRCWLPHLRCLLTGHLLC